ncbi:MAG: hypothetical protein LBE91_18785 [Tannerella sp.]|nr:hypothetical protein [Tannerella sp.]
MKKILGIFVIAVMGVMSFGSCDSIENREVMKGAVTEAEVRAKVTVEAVVRDGVKSNYIHVNSDGLANCVTSFKHGLGTYVGTNAVVQGFVVPGTFDIYVNVLNADGTMLPPIPFSVTVDECFDVAPEWELLCGTGEKVWTWDASQSRVWGNGGYLADKQPAWWGEPLGNINGQSNAKGEGDGATMVFSASGATLVKHRADGTVQSGTFSFDMSKTKTSAADGGTWAIGKLNTTSVTVLCGKAQNKGEGPVYNYDIIKLTDTEMVLAWPEEGDGGGGWSGCWYWMFKAQ